MRKAISLFSLMGVLLVMALAQISVEAQSLFVNAKLGVGAAPLTYTMALTWTWQGRPGGDFWLGDVGGVNFLHGTPFIITHSGASSHEEGICEWNGQLGMFVVDFFGATGAPNYSATAMTWRVIVDGAVVWSGSSGFEWVGLIQY